jgi:DeoR family transcriptional regulator of aga operon
MDISAEESQTKAFMAGVCDQVYGVFDSSKAERFALHPFVAADRVTGLYTDEAVPAHVVDDWAELGVPVHLAALSSGAGEPDLAPDPATGNRRTGRSSEAGAP